MNHPLADDAIEIMTNAGINPRPAQVDLLNMLSGENPRYVQAPTGVGKSFAVIAHAVARAMATGDHSIIIAADNTLLAQYASKDLPTIQADNEFEYAVVKGRRHYACASANNEDSPEYKRMLERALEAPLFRGSELAVPSEDIRPCNGGNKCIACAGPGACTNDECLHEDGICWSKRARRLAFEADVILTNTSMWLVNSSLHDETDGLVQLLPFGQPYVDEAQLLPNTVMDSLGWQMTEMSGGQLGKNLAPEFRDMVKLIIEEYVAEEEAEGRSADAPSPAKRFQDRVLKDVERKAIKEKLEDFAKRINKEKLSEDDMDEVETPQQFLMRRIAAMTTTVAEEKEDGFCLTWIDKDGIHWDVLNAGPEVFKACRGWKPKMVSATVPGSLPRRTGYYANSTLDYIPQMFDWSNNCKGIAFPEQYDPSDWQGKGWWQERWNDLSGLIDSAKGGSLILATSNADADRLASLARKRFPGRQVLLQEPGNTAMNPVLIERFRRDGNAILIGVESFWKGVDIQGPALSLVAIWKLPYEVPTLLHKAIGGKTREQQINFSIECMHTRLIQGIGRLLRSQSDKGVVVVCDGRFHRIMRRNVFPKMSSHLPDVFRND